MTLDNDPSQTLIDLGLAPLVKGVLEQTAPAESASDADVDDLDGSSLDDESDGLDRPDDNGLYIMNGEDIRERHVETSVPKGVNAAIYERLPVCVRLVVDTDGVTPETAQPIRDFLHALSDMGMTRCCTGQLASYVWEGTCAYGEVADIGDKVFDAMRGRPYIHVIMDVTSALDTFRLN